MPAVRLSRRRRSSLALHAFNSIKAGYYAGPPSTSPRTVTFAPNVTPGTYVEPSSPSSSDADSPTPTLFPPSDLPAPLPSRRRAPPGKRRSMGYIPRPPNAFMLFRADFVRQKHVPGSIETNHGSLSKIIGNCWRSLPLDEKRVWEVKAKHAKAEHKARYPEYRFRPVHNKNKDKKKDKPAVTAQDERRCEEVAQLLLEGKKGDDLAAAVRDLDRLRSVTPSPSPELVDMPYGHRRASSVPLPNDYLHHPIALPSVPFLHNMIRDDTYLYPRPQSRASRMWLGQRRASSAQPMGGIRNWTMPLPLSHPAVLQRDTSPLPEADTSLFDPSFLAGSSMGFGFAQVQQDPPYNFNDFFETLPPHVHAPHELVDLSQSISPLEHQHYDHDHDPHKAMQTQTHVPYHPPPHPDFSWLPADPATNITTAPSYSNSPSPSDNEHPHPHHPHHHHGGAYDEWKTPGAFGLDEFAATATVAATTAEDDVVYTAALEDLFGTTYQMAGAPPFQNGPAVAHHEFHLDDMVHESY